MLLNGAANRDPRRFECPHEFRVDRPNAQAHIAFGRGAHSCPGGPLARAEGRVSLERILDRMRDIRLVRGAPRPARRPPLPLRADVDPARPHQAAPGVRARRGRPMSRRRGRHRRRLGHRARRRPPVRRRRPPRSPSSTATARRAEAGRRRARARTAARAGRRGRRRRPGLGRRRRSSRCAPSSARSRSSSPAPAIESFDPVLDITPETVGPDHRGQPHRARSRACRPRCPTCSPPGGGASSPSRRRARSRARPNMAHYAASKGGVIALTKALAVELARSGITVNTIPPSLVDTPMARAGRSRRRLPRRRRGRARWSRSAGPAPRTTSPAACSFLCSDDGSYITGQIIGVNGGMYI